jgi:prepilin-type N-terminal cleavage/methylation domain-containing protein
MSFSYRKRSAFTLVELLVVIAIIGVLVALLLPAVQAAREAARRSSCANNIRQLAIGLHNFHDTQTKFPPGAQQDVLPVPNPTNSQAYFRGTSWIVFTLPYFEQKPLFDKYRFDLPYSDNYNLDNVGVVVVPTLYCPSGPDAKKHLDPNPNPDRGVTTHYYGVMGPAGEKDNFQLVLGGKTYTYREGDATNNAAWSYHGMFSQYKDRPGSISTNRVVRMADVIDGTTNTLMLGEISMHLPLGQSNQYRMWIRGNSGGSGATKNVRYPINSTFYNGSNNFNNISFGSEHPNGCHFVMADASVKFVTENIDLLTYQMSASMNGEENVQIP